jgi:hypothetical protein
VTKLIIKVVDEVKSSVAEVRIVLSIFDDHAIKLYNLQLSTSLKELEDRLAKNITELQQKVYQYKQRYELTYIASLWSTGGHFGKSQPLCKMEE